MPVINDEFASLGISKQRRYQLRRQAKALCTQCGAPALPGLSRCKKCHVLNYKRVIRLIGKPKTRRRGTKFKRALEVVKQGGR